MNKAINKYKNNPPTVINKITIGIEIYSATFSIPNEIYNKSDLLMSNLYLLCKI